MERNWYNTLNVARAEFMSAKNAGKRERKIEEKLKKWEAYTRDALIAAEELNFDKILEWRDSIAPKYHDQYFTALKEKAKNGQNRLLTDIMSGKEDLSNPSAWDLTLLECVIERVVEDVSLRMVFKTKISSIIQKRPEILIRLSKETLKNIMDNNGLYNIEKEELQSLLDGFPKTQKIYDFSQKIWGFNYLSTLFKGDQNEFKNYNINQKKMLELSQVVRKKWDSLADADLAEIKDFKSAVTLFIISSLKWKADLKNFKAVIGLMNNDEGDYEKLLKNIVDTFSCDSFYCHATVMAKEDILKKRLAAGEDAKMIFDLARKCVSYIPTFHPLPNFQRKIIKKFLE